MNEKIEIPGLENYTRYYELALEDLKAVCRSSWDPANHEYVSACQRVRHAWIRRNGLIGDHFGDQGTFENSPTSDDPIGRRDELPDEAPRCTHEPTKRVEPPLNIIPNPTGMVAPQEIERELGAELIEPDNTIDPETESRRAEEDLNDIF